MSAGRGRSVRYLYALTGSDGLDGLDGVVQNVLVGLRSDRVTVPVDVRTLIGRKNDGRSTFGLLVEGFAWTAARNMLVRSGYVYGTLNPPAKLLAVAA